MKYRRLTKEQFEALSTEFAQFLASQSIDNNQWQAIKRSAPHRVEAQLDAFSDLVWEESLRKTCFINHFSPGGVFAFHAGQMSLTLLGVKTATDLDFNEPESWQWLSKHWQEDSVCFYREQKPYDKERTQVLFALIERGGILSTGDIAQRLEDLIPESHS